MTNKRIDSPLVGIIFFVSNLLIMVLISALVKNLSDTYPVSQILLFRFVFAVIPLFVLMLFVHGIASMRTTRLRDHGIRSVSGVVSLSLFFYAISLIPIAEATMLAYASPIFITLLSIPILSEKIGIRRWGAVILGFLGVVVVAQPGSAIFSLGGLIAILSALTAAIVAIWLRKLSDTEHVTTIGIIYNSLGSLVFLGWTFVAGWVAISGLYDWLLLITVGIAASFQQFFFIIAFRYSEASLLAPFEYLILIFSAMVGYLFWQEVPALTSIIGGMLIVSGGLVILARSNKSATTIVRSG